MKLSFKFFCIAYIIVLLSAGTGGALIIENVSSTLFNSRIERVNAAAAYAADSFMEFADIYYGEISETQRRNIASQIKNSSDSIVTDVSITPSGSDEEEETEREGKGVSRFTEKNGYPVMESVCLLNTGTNIYRLTVTSDFTEVQKQCELFRRGYGIIIFAISVISGLLLLFSARKVTRPLRLLTKATDKIASGCYGETVNIKNCGYEIAALSESFNSMSGAVAQKIEEANDEIKKREIFIADFTHEIKTPMTAIMGYAQMLYSYKLDGGERKEAAGAIYSEAKRLEKLSLQLLELYVFRHEKIELDELSLAAAGKQLNATLNRISEKYGAVFSVNLGNETVYANETLLLSLLYNLADNAFKASEPGKPVEIYAESGRETVTVYVSDKGSGIAKENIRLLTEPFFREDKSRSRKLGGAGLGLSLCREIALIHGTELHFESERGKGTTVCFTLKKGGKADE